MVYDQYIALLDLNKASRMDAYIMINTWLRTAAKNKFEKDHVFLQGP